MPDLNDPTTLPLSEALLRWSDPNLVEAVKAEERRLTSRELALTFPPHPVLSDPAELRQPTPHDWMIGGIDDTPLLMAWQALERDFRSRLVRQEVFLSAVPAAPKRGTSHVPIPGVWAADFAFDLLADSLALDNARYVAVIASRVAPTNDNKSARGDSSQWTDAELDASDEEEIGSASRQSAARGGGRGRGTYEPLIRQAMMDNWTDVLKLACPPDGAAPNWSAIASMLHKRLLKKKRQEPDLKVPQFNTLRTRVGPLYEVLLTEIPALN